MTNTGPQPLDGHAFAANAERITNTAAIHEWTALYAPDATAEWVIDGARQHLVGRTAINAAATELATRWRTQHLRVTKTVQCADATTIALTWTGGFHNELNQAGDEIWTFRDGLVTHHTMHAHLDVRDRTSILARLRLALTAPRIVLALTWQRAHRTVTAD
ncbi:nuclear transport factor 2 family protein [Rhodococcus sp. BS-15]|uniref:nuclear transport factor 2 family protein n=1 Tax=Rhodococcus sp. BS-15 TaxID=1304954 RepID=UPI000A489D51|nr:nuclear transport factor 2 family protein [Rhodococcus sp. BS-15]